MSMSTRETEEINSLVMLSVAKPFINTANKMAVIISIAAIKLFIFVPFYKLF